MFDYIVMASAVFTAMSTIAAAPKVIIGIISFYYRIRREIYISFRKTELLIIPTSDEVARYSVKEPDSRRMTSSELTEECAVSPKEKPLFKESVEYRLKLTSCCFCLVFLAIEAKLFLFGVADLVNKSGVDVRILSIIIAACVFVVSYIGYTLFISRHSWISNLRSYRLDL